MRRISEMPAIACLVAGLLAGCASGPESPSTPLSAEDIAARCAAQGNRRIEASRIALPTTGAKIESATVVARTEGTPAAPDFCRLLV